MGKIWNRFLELQMGGGTYEAYVVPTCLPIEVVQQMLPASLRLAPQPFTPAGQHPVIFLLGKQNHVRMRHFKIFDLNYLEHIVAIPSTVRLSKGENDQPFVFHPRLHLDRNRPIFIGSLFGFAKRKARMDMSRKSYGIDQKDGFPILHAHFQRAAASRKGIEWGPHLDAFRSLFGQALVLRSHWRGLLFSRIDWDLDQAEIMPIRAHFEIFKPFLSGLKIGRIQVNPLNADFPLGAFKMTCHWSLHPALKWPYPSSAAEPT